jgi:hypothetical protein
MAYPYIPGYPGHTSGTQKTVSRIVIHATVSPTVKGGARSVARYFQSSGAGGSAHYIVDPGEIVRCYSESTVCWHAPPNSGSIGIELCDPQKGASSRWGDGGHEAMLKLAAKLTREVAARHKIPLKRLTVADLKAGRKGICGHVDVSNAFRQTNHTDPGTGFPWAHFMDLVTGSAPVQEDDMDPNTIVKVPDYWADKARSKFSHPTYSAAFLWAGTLNEVRAYGSRIEAKLGAQQVTIEKLATAVATLSTGQQIDPQVLIQEIKDELAKVTVRLDVGEPTQ